MLSILAPDDPALAVLSEVLKRSPSLEINLDIIPWVDYRETLMSALKAEFTPYNALFVPGHIWIPELAQAGYLSKLEPLISSMPSSTLEAYDADDILTSTISESSYKGDQYQLPFFSDGHILFCHKDFIELVADDEVPVISTKMISRLAASSHNPPFIYGLVLKADQSEIFTDFLPYLWEAGGWIFDKNGEPDLCNAKNIEALEYYCSLRKFCPPSTHEYGNAEVAQALRDGEAALISTWGGQSAPIFLDEENSQREHYRAAVFPTPWNATWGISIPTNQKLSSQQDILSGLLRILNSEQDRKIILAAGSPVRKSSYCKENMDRYSWLRAQKKMLEFAKPLPKDPKLGLFLGELYAATYKAFTGESTAKEALCFAQQEATKHYSKQ